MSDRRIIDEQASAGFGQVPTQAGSNRIRGVAHDDSRYAAVPKATRPLSIAVLTDHLKFSGGRKQLLEYAAYLIARGHHVDTFALSAEGELADLCKPRVVGQFSRKTLPDADLLISSQPRYVEAAVSSGRGRVIHFCQGSQVIDLEYRIESGLVPPRIGQRRFLRGWHLRRKQQQWKRKIETLDRIFKLPATLVTVSPHLQVALEQRYGQPVHLCRNGVHREFFFESPAALPDSFDENRPCRIVCAGPADQTVKGIPDTIEAVRLVKSRGCPVEFVRVSPSGYDAEQWQSGVIDECHARLNQRQLGKLFRSCDLFVSNSLEGEGFGLPAMEALACGLSCVLSDISSYRGFNDGDDFCHFVPPQSAEATAAALWDLIYSSGKQREDLRQRALTVAADYSFETARARFATIIEELAEH
jgi:glycosyltransferase involved in cell wall biosynthesis